MLLHLRKINYSLFEKKKIHITLEARKELFPKEKTSECFFEKRKFAFLAKMQTSFFKK